MECYVNKKIAFFPSFFYLFLLKYFLHIFTGQKLFNCHVCANSFSTKGSLKVHMRLHTGAKPFKCPHCDMRFRTSGRRKTHIQCHYKSDAKKVRRPVARRHLPQATVSATSTSSSTVESLQPINLLSTSSTDPSVFITNGSVLSSQFDQSLLHQGLVGQAILPASVSGITVVKSTQTVVKIFRNRVQQSVYFSKFTLFLHISLHP